MRLLLPAFAALVSATLLPAKKTDGAWTPPL